MIGRERTNRAIKETILQVAKENGYEPGYGGLGASEGARNYLTTANVTTFTTSWYFKLIAKGVWEVYVKKTNGSSVHATYPNTMIFVPNIDTTIIKFNKEMFIGTWTDSLGRVLEIVEHVGAVIPNFSPGGSLPAQVTNGTWLRVYHRETGNSWVPMGEGTFVIGG